MASTPLLGWTTQRVPSGAATRRGDEVATLVQVSPSNEATPSLPTAHSVPSGEVPTAKTRVPSRSRLNVVPSQASRPPSGWMSQRVPSGVAARYDEATDVQTSPSNVAIPLPTAQRLPSASIERDEMCSGTPSSSPKMPGRPSAQTWKPSRRLLSGPHGRRLRPRAHTMPYIERGLHEAMPLLLEALET